MFAEGRLEPDDILDEDGNVPGDVVREAFAMRKPTSDLVTNAALWDNLWKDDYVEGHQAMAQFIREQVPMPGALLRQIVDKLIRGNELATGATELSGRRVELRDIKCPLLVVMAERDELVPVESTLILREFMGPNFEELSLPAGHVGLITGRKAATVTIPHILGWIADHSQSLQESEVESVSSEKPPWRKAIEDYERSIGAPLEEFIKSDQFADMAAKAAKQQGRRCHRCRRCRRCRREHDGVAARDGPPRRERHRGAARRDPGAARRRPRAHRAGREGREQPEAAPSPGRRRQGQPRPQPKADARPKAKPRQGQATPKAARQAEGQGERQAAEGLAARQAKPKAE